MPVAVVTGASKGLGRALAGGLADLGWSVVIDARGGEDLETAEFALRARKAPDAEIIAVAGDVTDPGHRRRLLCSASMLGELDLLVNNAGTLGISPLPRLDEYPLTALRRVYEVNVFAPLAMVQDAKPLLLAAEDPVIVNLTSETATEHYEAWGGYGSAKAALDHVSGTLAEENPRLRVYAVDPGDMRTDMQRDAFPEADISDRPLPESVLPGLLSLITGSRPSGRYRAIDVPPVVR